MFDFQIFDPGVKQNMAPQVATNIDSPIKAISIKLL